MSVFTTTPDDILLKVLGNVDRQGIHSLFTACKEVSVTRTRLLEILEDEWFNQRTESQLVRELEMAYNPDHRLDVVHAILKPKRRYRLTTISLSSVLLQALKYSRSVAITILPCCECWTRCEGIDALELSLSEKPIHFVTCDVKILDEVVPCNIMSFSAIIMRTTVLEHGHIDCKQSPIRQGDTRCKLTFWLGSTSDKSGWRPVRMSLQDLWLTLHF